MYKIRFSYLGYTTIEKFVVIDNGRKRLNINLKMESQMLGNVVITSDKPDANVPFGLSDPFRMGYTDGHLEQQTDRFHRGAGL